MIESSSNSPRYLTLVWLKCDRIVCIQFPVLLALASQRMYLQARRKAMELQLTNCTFLQADAESVEPQENSFDSVFCSSAMLYMQDISLALKRFHKWLKPGGCLYFNTPQVLLQLHAERSLAKKMSLYSINGLPYLSRLKLLAHLSALQCWPYT